MVRAGNFREQIKAFRKLLDTVIVEKVSAELYCQKYLGHLLHHKEYYLTIYADTFEKYVFHSNKNIQDTSLIDFGAGNGMLGIFAKFCGFKQVFINDIDYKFIAAARSLAKLININMDGYITGDIHAVQSFFQHEPADAIIGTDVIEHVYSLPDLFKTIRHMNASMVSVFTTAANPKNYFKIKRLKKLQIRDEYEGGAPGDFLLFGEKGHEPFFTSRKRIIALKLKNKTEEVISALAKSTRGMNEADILSAVTRFNQEGIMPASPVHSTNTCNPVSSSWTERILSFHEYNTIYHANGIQLQIFNGFYDENKKGIKRILNKILNQLVYFPGAAFAPYIIFVGTKK